MAGRHFHLAGLLCVVVSSGASMPWAAQAAESWTGSVAASTDYIYRGVSQTDHEPALQADLQMQVHDGWSLGARLSTVDRHTRLGARFELDVHATRSWAFSPDWSAQLALSHYEFPNDVWLDYDRDELTASLSFQQRIIASIVYSPNTSYYSRWTLARNRDAVAYELTLFEPLARGWSLNAGVGYYDLDSLVGTGYLFWNAGISFTWDALQVDLLHIDTDATADRLFGYRAGNHRWTAALTWRF